MTTTTIAAPVLPAEFQLGAKPSTPLPLPEAPKASEQETKTKTSRKEKVVQMYAKGEETCGIVNERIECSKLHQIVACNNYSRLAFWVLSYVGIFLVAAIIIGCIYVAAPSGSIEMIPAEIGYWDRFCSAFGASLPEATQDLSWYETSNWFQRLIWTIKGQI